MGEDYPAWLPDMASTDGEPHEVFEALHELFIAGLIDGDANLDGIPIHCDVRVDDLGYYEKGFWHVIAREDRRTGERLLDPPRAQRLPWIPAILNHHDELEVVEWDYAEANGAVRTYLWFQPGDYCIILEKAPADHPVRMKMITAFHLDGPDRIRDLARKYEQRIQQND